MEPKAVHLAMAGIFERSNKLDQADETLKVSAAVVFVLPHLSAVLFPRTIPFLLHFFFFAFFGGNGAERKSERLWALAELTSSSFYSTATNGLPMMKTKCIFFI